MSASSRRAVVVSQPTTEGVAVGVLAVIEAAAARGWNITAVTPSDGWLGEATRAAGADWQPLEMARGPQPADVRHVVTLRKLAAAADVIHLHSSKAGALGRLALATLPRQRRPPCIFTPHAWSWLVGGRVARAYRAFEWLVAPIGDVVIAVSDEESAEGLDVLGRRVDGRLRVVANGVDPEAFGPDGPVADRAADPLVVSVGRLSHQKGQDVAIRALGLSRTPRLRLRLVGDGPEREALARLAADTGVSGRTEIVGNVLDPAPHLRAADLVVVPSRWDGLSYALLEAMACQRPVVATEVGGAGVLGPGGRLVPPDEPSELARAIDDLLGDPAARARMGRAGRARVERDYGKAESVRRTLDIWDELTSTPAPDSAATGASRRRTGRARGSWR